MLDWDYTDNIVLDRTIIFGLGYNFFGLDSLRQEAVGTNGNYLVWPNDGKWSLYRDSDGALSFEKFTSEQECKSAADEWCVDVVPKPEQTPTPKDSQ
jgi:hypothetical protein